MQAIWDAVAAVFKQVLTIKSLVLTMLTGSLWFILDDLMGWVEGLLEPLPTELFSFVDQVKAVMWEGWTASAGGYYLQMVVGQAHFWIGLDCLQDCLEVVMATICALLIWRISLKLIPFIG